MRAVGLKTHLLQITHRLRPTPPARTTYYRPKSQEGCRKKPCAGSSTASQAHRRSVTHTDTTVHVSTLSLCLSTRAGLTSQNTPLALLSALRTLNTHVSRHHGASLNCTVHRHLDAHPAAPSWRFAPKDHRRACAPPMPYSSRGSYRSRGSIPRYSSLEPKGEPKLEEARFAGCTRPVNTPPVMPAPVALPLFTPPVVPPALIPCSDRRHMGHFGWPLRLRRMCCRHVQWKA